MPFNADLPSELPIFPLSQVLLLPRAHLPLNIFEPRYLAMIDDVLKTRERLIGIIQPSSNGLFKIGCAGRIVSFSEAEDGRYMIRLQGISRFRLGAEAGGFTPYRRFTVSWAGFQDDRARAGKDPDFDRLGFFKMLRKYFALRGLDSDWDDLADAEDEMLINSLSMLCPFSVEEKQALLESPSLSDRRATLVTLIEFAFRGGAEEIVQ